MAEQAEELYDTLELVLCTIEIQLRQFGEYLGLDKSVLVGLNKRKVLREIRNFVDLTIDKAPADQTITIFTDWLSFLRRGEDKETGTENRNQRIVGDIDEIKLIAANGTPIPYEGWVELKLELLSDSKDEKNSIVVPFLVMKGKLDLPIIGFNAICELTRCLPATSLENDTHLIKQLKGSIPILADDRQCLSLITALKTSSGNEYVCAVKTSKKDIIVPQRSITPVKTRGNTGFIATHNTSAIFEPEITGGFPDGLQLAETLVMLKRGVTQYLTNLN
eukprot:gene9679-17449_t